MNALILAGGDLELSQEITHLAAQADFIVAADSGIRHARRLGLVPDLIVGDFDSASSSDLAAFANLPRESYSSDKDLLDLEIALNAVLAKAPSRIRIFGATGGRLDQTLAALLIASRHADKQLSLHSGRQSIYYLKDSARLALELKPQSLFSLLSLAETSVVSVKHARYELEHYPLAYGVGLGVSNRVSQSPLLIELDQGLIALVVEHYN